MANFWLHGHFLLDDGAKMSKSNGEFLRLRDLIDKGVDPLAYLYLCLTASYRSELRFTSEALGASQAALDRLCRACASWPEGGTSDAVLGLRLAEWRADEALVPMDITALTQERRRARAARDWAEADALRDSLRTLGWEVEDREQGQRLIRSGNAHWRR